MKMLNLVVWILRVVLLSVVVWVMGHFGPKFIEWLFNNIHPWPLVVGGAMVALAIVCVTIWQIIWRKKVY